jgi:hypothetical protein
VLNHLTVPVGIIFSSKFHQALLLDRISAKRYFGL